MNPLLIMAAASAAVTVAVAPDLTLRSHRPALHFEEAFVIGNGNLGATVYGGPQTDSLCINDITLWTGEPESVESQPDLSHRFAEVRRAVEAGDYRAADSLQRFVQGHFSQTYQPLGTLSIEYLDNGPITDYCRELKIDSALVRTAYRNGSWARTTSYIASAPDSVIMMHINSATPFNAILRFDSPLPHTTTSDRSGEITVTGYTAFSSLPDYCDASGRFGYDPERGIHFRTIISARNLDDTGRIEPQSDGAIHLIGTREAVIFLTNVTSFNGNMADPVKNGRDYRKLARRRIDALNGINHDSIMTRHTADYRNFFDRVSLNLGTTAPDIKALDTDLRLRLYSDSLTHDPELEALYFQFGRYLLISSSRTYGVPANLQGLWNQSVTPPWSGNYTLNINLQENYWPAEPTALGDLHAIALIPWIKNLSINGTETARRFYGASRGWAAGHNSDIWAMSCPVGAGSGDPSWANWNMGGAWLASHIAEHYRFTLDRDFLERYYPVLKGAAEFAMEMAVERDGELITAPSTSPENIYITPDGYRGATLYGATADLAIMRQCLLDACEAAETLGTDSVFRTEATAILSGLRPYHTGSDSTLNEWYHDWQSADPRHRHQSHLYGLYPGHHITPDLTPATARAAAATLDRKGVNTTGWSAGWRVCLRSRLRDGEGAYTQLRRLMRYVSPQGYRGKDRRTGGGTYPNLLDAHPPFQIDGNFGGTAGIAEMLLQSDGSTITLLPALPQAWNEGQVRGLRARGGYIVDVDWADGHVTDYRITPLPGAKPEPEVIIYGKNK